MLFRSELVDRLMEGRISDEFKSEIVSYWGQDSNLRGKRILSLIDGDRTQSRIFRAWLGKELIVIADEDETIAKWLSNRFDTIKSVKTSKGALIWLSGGLTPDQFPRAGVDVYRIAHSAGCSNLLEECAAADPAEIVTLFSLPADNGHALVSTIVKRPTRRGGAAVTRGFNKGSVPAAIAGRRYFGPEICFKACVERVDPAWIHGRDRDSRTIELQKAKVAVLGCGSVGAPVATMLAAAGVGQLYLVDKETLVAANVGRHPLGIDALGTPKSRSLAVLLRKCYPHTTFDHEVLTVERLLLEKPKKLEGFDLVVSALGSWPAEALLDRWHSSIDDPPAIVYCWTEPHAVAGHAVVLKGRDLKFRDGLDETGTPLIQITKWTSEMSLRAEPACGAFFQPYGPIEVGYVNNMIGELCLDVLLCQADDGIHRIWVAREALLRNAGGEWTSEWNSLTQFEGGHPGGVFQRKWAASLPQAS